MTSSVANSIKGYEDTVKLVESLTSFYALRESVKVLLGGCHLRLEVVFSYLRFLEVEDIPLNAITSHLPPVTVITSSSVYSFLDLVCAHFVEIVHHHQHNCVNYDNHLACETAASFIINGSSKNLDFHMLKKLGPFTSDHRTRNFITLGAFLSDPYTAVTAHPMNVRQYSLSQNVSKCLTMCSQFWKELSLRSNGLTIENAAKIVLNTLKNDIKTKTKCTELSFTQSQLPCLKISSSRLLANIIYDHLNRSFFTTVCCQLLGRILGHSELHQSMIMNATSIFPDITVTSHGINISEKQRMIILPSDLLPHNVYNENKTPEETTTSAICDVAHSIAKKVLDFYPSRLRLYEEDAIRPMVMRLCKYMICYMK